MTGVAFVMIGSQLGKLTGATVRGTNSSTTCESFVAGMSAVLIGRRSPLSMSVLAMLLVLVGWCRRSPVALIARARGDGCGGGFLVGRTRHSRYRPDPGGAARARPASVSVHDLAALLISVGWDRDRRLLRQRADRAQLSPRDTGEEIDANAELRALGICNVAAGLTHGFPVSSSGSRTALGDAVGSRTQLYSLVTLAERARGDVVRAGSAGARSRWRLWARWWSTPRSGSSTCRSSAARHASAAANCMLALATTVAVLGYRRALRRARRGRAVDPRTAAAGRACA